MKYVYGTGGEFNVYKDMPYRFFLTEQEAKRFLENLVPNGQAGEWRYTGERTIPANSWIKVSGEAYLMVTRYEVFDLAADAMETVGSKS